MHNDDFANRKTVDVSLRDLAAPLFRRRRLALITFLIVFAVLIFLGKGMTRKFKSQMSVIVHRERLDPLVSTESATTQAPIISTGVTLDEINSEAELLKSDDLINDVVIETGLGTGSAKSESRFLSRPDSEVDRIAIAKKNLARDLQVHNDSNSDLIQVTYTSFDPALAQRVLKSLGDLYIKKHLAVYRPLGTYTFFAQETDRYQKSLADSENRLRDFGKKSGVAAPDIVRGDLALQLANFIGQLHSAEQSEAADKQRMQSDQAQMLRTPPRSPTQQSSQPADKLLNDLRSTLLLAEAKRSQLIVKYQPTYPLVKEADEEIANTKAAIAKAEQTYYVAQTTDRDPTFELLREDFARTQADLAAQEATITSTEHSIQSFQGQMVKLDEQALTQRELLRDQKASEENYLSYLSKREQARSSDALDRARFANVAIAVPPSLPVLPAYSLTFVILVAFGLAFVFSMVLAYITDYFDSSFHTPTQVANSLGIPVVVSIRKSA